MQSYVLSFAVVLLTIFQLYLAFLVGYLLFLAAASWKGSPRSGPLPGKRGWRFQILVPAHNEERLLPELLASLERMDYAADLFEVHVVADNCTDQTAAVARRSRAQVHVRNDREHLGKGYALNWLLDRLEQAGGLHDAVVFIDADSVVSSNFLQIMAAHLERGERAIQAYYAARDPGQSWAGSLRYAALALLHFLRPKGRTSLGASAGLKGNGMVFAADLMKQYTWTSSLTEDIELHMALLLSGERVAFAPEAVVWGEMPNSLSSSTSQHMRWEQGRKQLGRRYVPRLLNQAWQELHAGRPQKAFVLFDAVMEYVQPPFSILAVANLLSLAASLAFYLGVAAASPWSSFDNIRRVAELNVFLAVLLVIGQAVYMFAGLWSVSAPKQVYLNLLYAPQLILWKTWQMALVLFGRGQNSWIRTKRNGG